MHPTDNHSRSDALFRSYLRFTLPELPFQPASAEAISLYEKALEGAKPKAANQIKYKIATTAQETGDKAKAIEYYTAIAGDPNFAEFANYQIKELSK